MGDEVLVGLAGPGMPLGMPLTGLVSYQARALTDVYCLWVSLTDLQRSGALAQALLSQLMRRLRQTEALLAITAGQRRVEDRFAAFAVAVGAGGGGTGAPGGAVGGAADPSEFGECDWHQSGDLYPVIGAVPNLGLGGLGYGSASFGHPCHAHCQEERLSS
jgi:hypothetical protein